MHVQQGTIIRITYNNSNLSSYYSVTLPPLDFVSSQSNVKHSHYNELEIHIFIEVERYNLKLCYLHWDHIGTSYSI